MYVRASSVVFGIVSGGVEVVSFCGVVVGLVVITWLRIYVISVCSRTLFASFSHLFLICSISLTHKRFAKRSSV